MQTLAQELRPEAVRLVKAGQIFLRERKWFGQHLPALPPMIMFFSDHHRPEAYYEPRNNAILINTWHIARNGSSLKTAVCCGMASYTCQLMYNMAKEIHTRALNVRTAMRPTLHAYKSARWHYYYDHFMAAIK